MKYHIIQSTLHIIYVSNATRRIYNVILEQALLQFEGKSIRILKVEIMNKNHDF